MSDLFKRTAKYYFRQGIKLFSYISLGVLAVAVMWTVTLLGEGDDWSRRLFLMLLEFFEFFMPYAAFMFSLYAATLNDGIVLSMGARRKDIFIGNLIKQGTYALCNALGYLLLALPVWEQGRIKHVLFVIAMSLAAGASGYFFGYKVDKYNNAVAAVVAIVYMLLYVLIRYSFVIIDVGFSAYAFENNVVIYALGALLIFAGMEVLIYRANKYSSVVT